MDFGICFGDCGDLGCFLWLFGIEWCECGDWEFILVCLDWDEVEVVVMVIFFGLGEDLEVGVVDFFFFDCDIGMRVGMFLWIIEWNLGLLLVLVFFLVLEFFVLFLVGVDFFSCCFLVFFFFSGGMMDFVDGFFLMLLYVWVSMVNGFFFVLSWKWK